MSVRLDAGILAGIHLADDPISVEEQTDQNGPSNYLPVELCRKIGEFAAPCADHLSLVNKDFEKATNELRRRKTCACCCDLYREMDQVCGLGIRAKTGCAYHPGRLVQWVWDDELMPGFQFECCKEFVFDPDGMHDAPEDMDGVLRYDEARLRQEAVKIRGCAWRRHVEGRGPCLPDKQSCQRKLARHSTVM